MNRLLKAASALVCAVGLTAFASTSNATATITDSDGQTWGSATFTATLVTFNAAPTIAGTPVTPLRVSGTLSASGVLVATLTDTSSIDQTGSTWSFHLCSNTSSPCVDVTGIAVIGATPNLSTALSTGLRGPRFSASPNAYGYLDGEVVNPAAGSTYYNVTLQVLRQWNGAAWTGTGGSATSSATVASIGPAYFFGDSIFAGVFAANNATLYALLSRDYAGPTSNWAVSGSFTAQIANQLYQRFPPVSNTTIAPPVVVQDGGVNDANAIGATTGAVNNYKAILLAEMAWANIPLANKKMASTASLSGFGTTYNSTVLNTLTIGTAKQSATLGDTATFSLTAAGTAVGVTWLASTVDTGTFSVTLDGALQTNTCTGTTTFNNFGCNGQAVSNTTYFRQEFPVTPGAHTLVVTVTSATAAGNKVTILDADSTPTSTAGQPLFIQSGVLRQFNDASAAATAAFDAAAISVVNQLVADNLNVVFVDVRGGVLPGVNATTDMATTTAACPATATNTPLHPNQCGYVNYAQTVENAVSNYHIFSPGSGGSAGTFAYPITTTIAFSTDSRNDSWNSNGGQENPSSTVFTPMYCSWPLVSSGGVFACNGLLWDAVHSASAYGVASGFPLVLQYCPVGTTVPSACFNSAFWDIAGNQTNRGSITLGTTVAPTCDATKRGQIQYTAGTAGVKDIVQVCAKDATDVYAYRAIY